MPTQRIGHSPAGLLPIVASEGEGDDSVLLDDAELAERRRRCKNFLGRTRYGPRHRRERGRWAKMVAAGGVRCCYCDREVEPGSLWDLCHSEVEPALYMGVAHAGCNRGEPHRNRTSRVW